MDRLSKAAIAVGGAAVLLLGGAGTLAYWTGSGSASGTSINSGSFDLGEGRCDSWVFVPEDGGGPLTTIVPGATVSADCTFLVEATGDHIGIGDVSVSDPTWVESNGLTAELGTATVLATTLNGVPFTTPVPTTDGDEIVVTIGVVFLGPDATNASQNLTATLDAITVTISQVHIAPA